MKTDSTEPPYIEPYFDTTDVKASYTKTLRCAAEGYPAPVVTWYKEGKPAINITNCDGNLEPTKVCKNIYEITERSLSSLRVNNVLKIKQLQYPRDNGTYTCEAKNDYGTASLTIQLNVQGDDIFFLYIFSLH